MMPSKDTKLLEFDQYWKSDKAPCFVYVDLECLIEKFDWCKNNPKIHLQQKQLNKFQNVFQCLQYHHL